MRSMFARLMSVLPSVRLSTSLVLGAALLFSIFVTSSGCTIFLLGNLGREDEIERGSVKGRLVRADDDNAPAAFARISLPGSSRAVRADSDGNFVVRGLTQGSWALRISDDPNGDGWPDRALVRPVRIAVLAHSSGPVDSLAGPGGDPVATGVDLGDIALERTGVLDGEVTLAGGNPLPPGVVGRVLVVRSIAVTAGDLDRVETFELGVERETHVDDVGRFYAAGLAGGEAQILAVAYQDLGGGQLGAVLGVSAAQDFIIDPTVDDGVQNLEVALELPANVDPLVPLDETAAVAIDLTGDVGTEVYFIFVPGGRTFPTCDASPIDYADTPFSYARTTAQMSNSGTLNVQVPVGAWDVAACSDAGDGPLAGYLRGQVARATETGPPLWGPIAIGSQLLSCETQVLVPESTCSVNADCLTGDEVDNAPLPVCLRALEPVPLFGNPTFRCFDTITNDCDHDTIPGLPLYDPNNEGPWVECRLPGLVDGARITGRCGGLIGDNVAEARCIVRTGPFAGEYDCDDDGDGQSDTDEPSCYGDGLGTDLDLDGVCSPLDAYPLCRDNTRELCEADRNDAPVNGSPMIVEGPRLVLDPSFIAPDGTVGIPLNAQGTALSLVTQTRLLKIGSAYFVIGSALSNGGPEPFVWRYDAASTPAISSAPLVDEAGTSLPGAVIDAFFVEDGNTNELIFSVQDTLDRIGTPPDTSHAEWAYGYAVNNFDPNQPLPATLVANGPPISPQYDDDLLVTPLKATRAGGFARRGGGDLFWVGTSLYELIPGAPRPVFFAANLSNNQWTTQAAFATTDVGEFGLDLPSVFGSPVVAPIPSMGGGGEEAIYMLGETGNGTAAIAGFLRGNGAAIGARGLVYPGANDTPVPGQRLTAAYFRPNQAFASGELVIVGFTGTDPFLKVFSFLMGGELQQEYEVLLPSGEEWNDVRVVPLDVDRSLVLATGQQNDSPFSVVSLVPRTGPVVATLDTESTAALAGFRFLDLVPTDVTTSFQLVAADQSGAIKLFKLDVTGAGPNNDPMPPVADGGTGIETMDGGGLGTDGGGLGTDGGGNAGDNPLSIDLSFVGDNSSPGVPLLAAPGEVLDTSPLAFSEGALFDVLYLATTTDILPGVGPLLPVVYSIDVGTGLSVRAVLDLGTGTSSAFNGSIQNLIHQPGLGGGNLVLSGLSSDNLFGPPVNGLIFGYLLDLALDANGNLVDSQTNFTSIWSAAYPDGGTSPDPRITDVTSLGGVVLAQNGDLLFAASGQISDPSQSSAHFAVNRSNSQAFTNGLLSHTVEAFAPVDVALSCSPGLDEFLYIFGRQDDGSLTSELIISGSTLPGGQPIADGIVIRTDVDDTQDAGYADAIYRMGTAAGAELMTVGRDALNSGFIRRFSIADDGALTFIASVAIFPAQGGEVAFIAIADVDGSRYLVVASEVLDGPGGSSRLELRADDNSVLDTLDASAIVDPNGSTSSENFFHDVITTGAGATYAAIANRLTNAIFIVRVSVAPAAG